GDDRRKLAGYPDRHEAADREARRGAMIAVGDGAVPGVDIGDQLRKIIRELALGLHWTDVPRAHVLLFRLARIEAVQLDHDQIVRGDVGPDGVSPVVCAGGVIAVLLALHLLVVPLAATGDPAAAGLALGR